MTRQCVICGVTFEAVRATAECCGDVCRKRKQRGGGKRDEGVTAGSTRTQHAVHAELEAAGRLETVLGAAAMALAERIDTSSAVMGFAPLVKELRSTMDAALAGVKVAEDPLDELRARRERKLDAS